MPVVLGLLFPKCISDLFEARRAAMAAEQQHGTHLEYQDEYRAEAIFSAMTKTMASPAPLLPLLTEHLEPLRELCRRYGVERLAVSGSAAKGTFDPATSDLDFIACFSTTSAAMTVGGSHLEFLMKEPSMEAFLRSLLPRLLPQNQTFAIEARWDP